MIGIIDHKKIDMSQEDWDRYRKMIKSYTTVDMKGEDLFVDLFETNNDGIITTIKSPSNRRTSFEIFLFIIAIYQHQHMKLIHEQVDDICEQFKEKIKELNNKSS
jgi:hypothetical protein